MPSFSIRRAHTAPGFLFCVAGPGIQKQATRAKSLNFGWARIGRPWSNDHERFDTGAGASAGSLVGIVLETGESVMAGGDFQTMDGSAKPGLVRLNDDGSVDATFNAGLGGGAGDSP